MVLMVFFFSIKMTLVIVFFNKLSIGMVAANKYDFTEASCLRSDKTISSLAFKAFLKYETSTFSGKYLIRMRYYGRLMRFSIFSFPMALEIIKHRRGSMPQVEMKTFPGTQFGNTFKDDRTTQ